MHLRALVTDGAFVEHGEDSVRWLAAPPTISRDLAGVLAAVHRGLGRVNDRDEDEDVAAAEPGPAGAALTSRRTALAALWRPLRRELPVASSCDVRCRVQPPGAFPMSVARVTEIISASNKSFEDAVNSGVARASKTLKNVRSAWVQDQKVTVEQGKISEYRVTLKVTFVLED